MQCTVCKGKGKQTIKSQNLTVDGWEALSPVDVPCLWCDGTGEMTPEEEERLRVYSEMWCKCVNPSGDTNFYDDGEHPEVTKHHYRCADCGKVTQVG